MPRPTLEELYHIRDALDGDIRALPAAKHSVEHAITLRVRAAARDERDAAGHFASGLDCMSAGAVRRR